MNFDQTRQLRWWWFHLRQKSYEFNGYFDRCSAGIEIECLGQKKIFWGCRKRNKTKVRLRKKTCSGQRVGGHFASLFRASFTLFFRLIPVQKNDFVKGLKPFIYGDVMPSFLVL